MCVLCDIIPICNMRGSTGPSKTTHETVVQHAVKLTLWGALAFCLLSYSCRTTSYSRSVFAMIALLLCCDVFVLGWPGCKMSKFCSRDSYSPSHNSFQGSLFRDGILLDLVLFLVV